MVKTVEIKKQPRLGLAKTMSLTVNGIRYRLFRSTVTMIVITVAIAFMMNSLSESILKRNIAAESHLQIADTRLATTWASRLSVTGSVEDIIQFCSIGFEKGEPKFEETITFAGSDDSGMQAFGRKATSATRYLNWFGELNYEDRRKLVHQAEGVEVFDRLRDADHFAKFESNLKEMRWLRFVDEQMTDFKGFLKEWPEVKVVAQSILTGRKAAIEALKPSYKGRTLTQALRDADGEFGKTIEAAGFKMSPVTAKRIAFLARRMTLQRFLEQRVVKMDIRKEVAKRYDVLPKDVSALMLWDELLVSKNDAIWTLRALKNQWLLEEGIKDNGFKRALAEKLGVEPDKVTVKQGLSLAMKDDGFVNWLESQPVSQGRLKEFTVTPEEAVAMADARERLEKYISAERQCADVRADSFLGMGKRMTWLLLVSLVVCIVGIANAMLMTVTERFREIATLKCLGALDGFIMLMFVFEATILGIVGGFFGSIFGGIIGIGRMRVSFGDILWESFSASDMLLACLIAMLMGVVMAALAAIYPSLQASRMAPMEAMRID